MPNTREKLIELLKYSPFLDVVNGYKSRPTFEMAADHLIANDVVPVVRCKDCYYFTEENDFRTGKHLGYGECHRCMGLLFKDNDFCSYGERRDSE